MLRMTYNYQRNSTLIMDKIKKKVISKNSLIDVSVGDKVETFVVHKSAPAEPGFVYAPFVMCEHTEETLKEYNDIMDKYRAQHRCCPICSSRNYSTTLVGFFLDANHPDDYKDRNSVHCLDCGWKGIVHDLVPEKDA